MVRGLRPHVAGRRIRSVGVPECDRRPIALTPAASTIARRARGRTIVDVRRLAKRVVLDLDDGSAFAVEPRMTGLMVLADPPTREHLRLRWRLEPRPPSEGPSYDSVWFWDRRGLGTVRLFGPGELDAALAPKLGPDPLTMTAADWRPRLAKTARAVKVALLDQTLAAGIGNLYASEILHAARLDPSRPASSLDAAEVRRLSAAARRVLNAAIEYEGSTLSDGTYRNALGDPGRYVNEHRVYQRHGTPCPRCGADIRRDVHAQRSTFWCAGCQV